MVLSSYFSFFEESAQADAVESCHVNFPCPHLSQYIHFAPATPPALDMRGDLKWFPSINGLFPQSLRQTAGFLVRLTTVRLRVIPCFPWSCEKILISGLETFFVSSQKMAGY